MSTSEPEATWQALKADKGPELCTEAMAAEDDELLPSSDPARPG